MFRPSYRISGLSSLAIAVLLFGCNAPFQVKQVYSPQLVVYGIVFRGDSSVVIRVETNSESETSDSSASRALAGLNGSLTNQTKGVVTQLVPSYRNGINLMEGYVNAAQRNVFTFQAGATGYSPCTASVTILDSAVIYPAYWTQSALQDPNAGNPDPQFTVYPSARTMAVHLSLILRYRGLSPNDSAVSGEITVSPSYQQSMSSYFLRINGATTPIIFLTSDYTSAYVKAIGALKSGTVVAVVKLTQVDATLYDFYSISNGFNDPLTMRTEKPVFTNINGGLGFLGSASYDSISIPVYP